jgi:tRNA(fMet)-specific endonuclease VapC
MIVADSDVLIDALRGKEPSLSRIALELGTGSLATTSITVFELRSGARTAAEREKVERLLAPLVVLPFDEPAARAAADARLALEATGQTIGTADLLIAGICLSRDGVLLTRNRAHFERVKGLRLGRESINDRE